MDSMPAYSKVIPNNKHVWLQCLPAAGGQASLASPKGEKSVQHQIANGNLKLEKAGKQRRKKVCASQKSLELCDEGLHIDVKKTKKNQKKRGEQ